MQKQIHDGWIVAPTIMNSFCIAAYVQSRQCSSLANPVIAAATSANYGRLQKMPCVPITPFPWLNGKILYLGNSLWGNVEKITIFSLMSKKLFNLSVFGKEGEELLSINSLECDIFEPDKDWNFLLDTSNGKLKISTGIDVAIETGDDLVFRGAKRVEIS